MLGHTIFHPRIGGQRLSVCLCLCVYLSVYILHVLESVAVYEHAVQYSYVHNFNAINESQNDPTKLTYILICADALCAFSLCHSGYETT